MGKNEGNKMDDGKYIADQHCQEQGRFTRIEIRVPAVPVPQPAKEHRIVKTASKEFITAQTPTRHPVNAYKATVARAAEDAYSRPPLDGPLSVSMIFVFPRRGKPSWLTRKAYPEWFSRWKQGLRIPHVAKGRHDRDNLMKATQDAVTGIVWADDGLIFTGLTEKWVAAEGEQAHVELVIQTTF